MANFTGFHDSIDKNDESHVLLNEFSMVKSSPLAFLNVVKCVKNGAMLNIPFLWEVKATWHNLQKALKQMGKRGIFTISGTCSTHMGSPIPPTSCSWFGQQKIKSQADVRRRQTHRQGCGWPQAGSAAGKVSIAHTESLLEGWAPQKEAPDVLMETGGIRFPENTLPSFWPAERAGSLWGKVLILPYASCKQNVKLVGLF